MNSMSLSSAHIAKSHSLKKQVNPLESQARLPSPQLVEPSEELHDLHTHQTQIVQSLLPVLEILDYDKVNQGIRADYLSSPLPYSSYRLIDHDLKRIPDNLLQERQRLAVNFFMLGNAVSDLEFQNLAGKQADSLKEAGIASGLIVHSPEGLRLNNLALISSKQENGKIIYCFADLPPYYQHEYKKQRIYSGADSCILNWRLMQIPSASGVILEAGSGSGYQIFTMLNKHPGISTAIGIEIDSRARNVSKLNAALNGMESKFSVFETFDMMDQALGGKSINLAFSNPPFICVPEYVKVAGNEVQLLPEFCRPDPKDLLVNINRLFMKAGAGGKDGLAVTRIFFESIRDKLADSAEFLVFSQFSVDSAGNPLAIKLDNQDQFSYEFEKFSGMGNFSESFNYALYLIGALETQHPPLKDSKFIFSVGSSAMMTFAAQGIKGFQSGFVKFKKSEPSSYKESTILAPENITPSGIRKIRPAPLLGFRPDFVL